VEKVVAVSTWEQNELRQVGVTKPILLIGNGFETMPISKDVIKGKYIIFVGRIDKIKNLEGMIIMFSKLLKSNFFRGWKLHIIGNSPRDVEYVEKLKKLSEETGVIDSVCFFGVVRGEEKMLHIAKAQLLICISFFETDPIVVKEALSVKTKVLISGNYGLGDYVDNPNSFTIYENELDVDDIIAFINSPFVETADFVGWKEISEQYKKLLLGSDF
jgi:glycosyltransferase involved in cell wall biosynthesis